MKKLKIHHWIGIYIFAFIINKIFNFFPVNWIHLISPFLAVLVLFVLYCIITAIVVEIGLQIYLRKQKKKNSNN